ncbi:hypothetical protein ACH4SP_22665 [Streptomyces sp. NPDC021093]|uniref:hypothetical protein n=1 Tax=Streptomyces sp. NPDC021093 TaxID=3365112 RepID=UPI0037A409A7
MTALPSGAVGSATRLEGTEPTSIGPFSAEKLTLDYSVVQATLAPITVGGYVAAGFVALGLIATALIPRAGVRAATSTAEEVPVAG